VSAALQAVLEQQNSICDGRNKLPRQRKKKKRYALVTPAYSRQTLACGGKTPSDGPQKEIEKRNTGYSGCPK
jgi:hypothetical protein